MCKWLWCCRGRLVCPADCLVEGALFTCVYVCVSVLLLLRRGRGQGQPRRPAQPPVSAVYDALFFIGDLPAARSAGRPSSALLRSRLSIRVPSICFYHQCTSALLQISLAACLPITYSALYPLIYLTTSLSTHLFRAYTLLSVCCCFKPHLCLSSSRLLHVHPPSCKVQNDHAYPSPIARPLSICPSFSYISLHFHLNSLHAFSRWC